MYRKFELLLAASPIGLGLGSILGAYYTIALPGSAYTFDPVGPRGFAYVVGVMLFSLGLILLATTIAKQRRYGGIGARSERDPEESGDDMRYPASSLRAVATMALTLAFALIVDALGYILVSIALMVGALLVMGNRSWRTISIYSVVYALSTYLIFHSLLGVRLPVGIAETFLATFGL